MTKGLIFDIDGTLVTLVFDAIRTRGELIDELRRTGLDAGSLSVSSTVREILDEARRQTSAAPASSFEEVRKRLYKILETSELRTSSSATALPGARMTLESLKRRSVKLAVLTNSGRRPALAVLEREGLLGFFDFVLTRDDVDAMKPSPVGLEAAVRLMGLPKAEVCYVGDSSMDVAAGKGAGVRVISVATGGHDAERLRAGGSDVVLGSLEELPPFLDAHGGPRAGGEGMGASAVSRQNI